MGWHLYSLFAACHLALTSASSNGFKDGHGSACLHHRRRRDRLATAYALVRDGHEVT
jgi:hypothetical protein